MLDAGQYALRVGRYMPMSETLRGKILNIQPNQLSIIQRDSGRNKLQEQNSCIL